MRAPRLLAATSLVLLLASSACHLVYPFDVGAEDATARDAGPGVDGSSGMRALIDDRFEAAGSAPGWTFSEQGGQHHQVGQYRLELWTPSSAPPYYGPTLGRRTVSAAPATAGAISVEAHFMWRDKVPAGSSGGSLQIGLEADPDLVLQVFSSKGALMARFGTSLQPLAHGVLYRLELTVGAQVRARLCRVADDSVVLDAVAARPADLAGLKVFRFMVETTNLGAGQVHAVLTRVRMLQEIVP